MSVDGDDDELDPENVREERVTEDLPAPTDDSALERMEATLRDLDGVMALSNATVPLEATDVGDVPIDPNPDASALGYTKGYELTVETEGGQTIFSDPPNAVLAGECYVSAAPEDVIDDVTKWA
jgi:hypothetical protein